MKRIFQHPPEEETGRKYWRSLGEYAETPEFQEWLSREFPPGAAEFEAGGVSRRSFLQLMGASMALAGFGMAGCRRPESFIVPYAKSVEWEIPGRALYYASAMPRRGGALPLVATTYEGRPTHLDGNRLVPGYAGGLDPVAQASILDVYDPDRAWNYVHDGQSLKRNDFLKEFRKLQDDLQSTGGEGYAMLLEDSTSPTRERLLNEVQEKFPNLQISVYQPVTESNLDAVLEKAYGAGSVLRNDYSAKRILALDCDFLGVDDSPAVPNQELSRGRKVHDEDNVDDITRLYVVEPHFSITGGMADHRLRLPASQVFRFAAAIAKELGVSVPELPEAESDAPIFDPTWATQCARDLKEHGGESLIVAGPRQPQAVQELVLMINDALGNIGKTVKIFKSDRKKRSTLRELTDRINQNQVKTLFVVGGNPAYSAPADLKFAETVKKVGEVVRLGYYQDETSVVANWFIPLAHYLESWGDDVTANGTYVPVQPMIAPLNEGLSEWDFLAILNGADRVTVSDELKKTFKERVPSDPGEEKWNAFLKNGFLPDSQYQQSDVTSYGGDGSLARQYVNDADETSVQKALANAPGETYDAASGRSYFELNILPDPTIEDGRYSNNGWLQELPDPVTKLTWDNVALISPRTAKYLGLDHKPYYNLEGEFDQIIISANGYAFSMPVHILPGAADFTVTMTMGYGREESGRVGRHAGTNVMPLVTSDSGQIISRAKVMSINEALETGDEAVKAVAEAAKPYTLAFAQVYSYMEGRALVREGTFEEYQKKPEFVKKLGMDSHIPPNVSLYKTPPYGELAIHQWGMTIDLNSCTGCNACVIACQSENNIPIVGKIQVAKGREMHWIRLDRYFATVDYNQPLEDADPQMVVQPVACVHCENAPCETVCPVNATVHSEDGLNVMAYNRCIGTRYCANNCPYKARRFNFFDYNDRPVGPIEEGPLKGRDKLELGPLTVKGMKEPLQLSKNPNVTVRMRGVMEKCTYCVQRIEQAKIDAKVKARDSANFRIPANTVRVACQDACPSDAISFGDLANEESEVVKMKKQARNYRIIEYLNTQARTSYLARIRNPNRDMPDFKVAYAGGLTKARHHYDHKYHKEHGHGKEMHGDDHGVAKPMKPLEHPAEPAETGHPPADPHHH